MPQPRPHPTTIKLARYIAELFEGSPTISVLGSEDGRKTVDILCCKDSPCKGVSSYSTTTLWQKRELEEGGAKIAVEVVGACATFQEYFLNAISTVAFNVMDGKPAFPGALHLNAISEYYPDLTCKHVMLVTPFLWDRDLQKQVIEGLSHLWLQVVPITDEEADYLMRHGSDALESIFEEHQIDLFDLNRPSCL